MHKPSHYGIHPPYAAVCFFPRPAGRPDNGNYLVLREHYSKANEENKKFASPEQHITDKYFNKNSPYYVKGLTQKEHEICATQE